MSKNLAIFILFNLVSCSHISSERDIAGEKKESSRNLSSLSVEAQNENFIPIVLVMVDGVRPDYIKYLSKKGELPFIKKYFMDEGAFANNSFTSLSLTVPSWATILSGVDVDETGFKGNEVFNRKSKAMINYLDQRVDLCANLEPMGEASRANTFKTIYNTDDKTTDGGPCGNRYRLHSRAYRQMKSLGHDFVIDHFNKKNKKSEYGLRLDDNGAESDYFMTYYPVYNTFPTYMFPDLGENILFLDYVRKSTSLHNSFMRYLFEGSGFSAIDRSSFEEAHKVIRSTKGKMKKLVGLYFSSVDHFAHIEHERGIQELKVVDKYIGLFMKSLRRSRYRNAIVAFVSDHGSLGGEEFEAEDNHHNPLRGYRYGLSVTNISSMLNGSFNIPGFDQYNMNVTSSFATEGNYSLSGLSQYQLQAMQCVNINYVERKKSCEKIQRKEDPTWINAATTTSQSISLPYGNYKSGDWDKTNSWYELTHYGVGVDKESGKWVYRNLIKDLESYETTNLTVLPDSNESQKSHTDHAHQYENSEQAKKAIGTKPLDWLAIKIKYNDFVKSQVVSNLNLRPGINEDILLIHQADNSQALIMTRLVNGRRVYKYLPVKNFNQNKSGEIFFELSTKADPFGYISNIAARMSYTGKLITDKVWFNKYHSQHDWSDRYAKTSYPNTVTALWKNMMFSGTMKRYEEQYRVDIHLSPKYGHIFSPYNLNLEVNHGHFQKEAVRNSFMMNGPGIKTGHIVEDSVHTTDFLHTVFEARNKANKLIFGKELPSPMSSRLVGKSLNDFYIK